MWVSPEFLYNIPVKRVGAFFILSHSGTSHSSSSSVSPGKLFLNLEGQYENIT